MTKLFLIRHGETDWNLEGRWQGQADVALNALGRQQAKQVAGQLANIPFAAIYTSDLKRAADTAAEIAAANSGAAGHPPRIIADRRLREIHQGEWQGLLVQEIEARYAEAFRQRLQDPLSIKPPGGETAYQVRERALAAISDILAAYPQGNVAVISHGFTIAVLLTHFRLLPMEKVWDLVPGNGAVTVLTVDGSKPTLPAQ